MILQIALEFTNNTSWRFVASDFVFPTPINWNVIDPTVFHEKNSGLAPSYVYQDAIFFNNLTRQVRESEVFPNRSIDPTAGDIDRVAMWVKTSVLCL